MKRFAVLACLAVLIACSFSDGSDAKPRGGVRSNDKTLLMGVNIGCMACGSVSPGTPNVDYIPPSLEDIEYYASRNLYTYRLPFSWARAQNTIGGALNTTYLGYLEQAGEDAASVGGCVIYDMHNFGGRDGLQIGAVGGPTIAQFAEFWGLLADELKDNPGTCGYDLMNEPHDMPNADVTFDMYQAAIDEVRAVDTATKIYINGDAYGGTFGWLGNCSNCGGAPIGGWNVGGNDQLKGLVDPNDNLVFSGHQYADANGGGFYPVDNTGPFGGAGCTAPNLTSYECAQIMGDQLTTPTSVLDTDIMVKRFTPFVNWCVDNNLRCHIGEHGVANDDPNWLIALDKGIDLILDNNIEFSYWNADGGSLNYSLNVDRRENGQDALQMAVLTKYSNAYPPDFYTISGPEYGDQDLPSTNFTVQYNGYVEREVTFTPDDNGAGGTFTPTTITIEPGFNATVNFTYTAPDEGTYEITALNDGGWQVPDRIGYSTYNDVFRANSVEPYKVISMQRIYTPYVGPCVTLRRASDDAVATFGWESLAENATCDQDSAVAWANGSNMYVVTAYDQTLNGENWTAPIEDGSAVGAPSNADQPRFIPEYQNGLPAILWNNSRMQTTSPINGLTGHTLLTVYRPTSQLSQTALIGHGWAISADVINAYAGDLYQNTGATITTARTYTKDATWSAVGSTFDTASGGVIANGGSLVGRMNAGGHTINQPYRTYATIGFSVFSGSRFAGYSGEMITVRSKIDEDALLALQEDQVTRWSLEGMPDYSYYAPTLDQSTTAENDAPWMGVGGTGGYAGFGLTPSDSYGYWADKGANIYRYVVLWETMQPGLCTGNTTLNPTALAAQDLAIAQANAAGMDVLIDLHNYGTYNYNYHGACGSPPDDGKISNATTRGYFANYWKQIANHYASNPKVKFDIMNEPHNVTDAEMMTAAQAVIDQVRGDGNDHWIFVEFGTGFSACSSVAANGGPAFLTLTDPSDRIVLTCHQYITPCGYDACGPTSNNGQGKSSLTSATAYVKANNIKLFWGEAGIAAYGPQQYAETKNALDYIAANLDTGTGGWVGWNVWGAGTWGESYTFKQDPWSYAEPLADRPTVRLLNTYFTGNSWLCNDETTGTAGVCSGTWPNAKYP